MSRNESRPGSSWAAPEALPDADASISDHADASPLPVVRAFGVEAGRHARTVHVRCPFCARTHVHGWPYGDATIGARGSHCATRYGARGIRLPDVGGQYWIEAPR